MLLVTRTIAGITVLEAMRSRLSWVALIAIGLVFAAAQFLGQVAIIEVDQIQLALMAAILRVIAAFLVAAFCITSIVREANDKITELFLSQPAARAEYYLGKIAGCAVVALALAGAFALTLAFFAPAVGVAYWGVSLACELLIVAAVAIFCAVSLAQLTSAFAATAGFYLLARSITAMQMIAATPLGSEGPWTDATLRTIVDAIALAMPALDQMAQTGWLLGRAPDAATFAGLLIQTVVYLLLIGLATLVDLYRKNY